MPTIIANLTEHDERFVERLVESGRYADASEVIEAGLRLLERQVRSEDAKISKLRSLCTDGFRSLDDGACMTITNEADLRLAIACVGSKVVKSSKSDHKE